MTGSEDRSRSQLVETYKTIASVPDGALVTFGVSNSEVAKALGQCCTLIGIAAPEGTHGNQVEGIIAGTADALHSALSFATEPPSVSYFEGKTLGPHIGPFEVQRPLKRYTSASLIKVLPVLAPLNRPIKPSAA